MPEGDTIFRTAAMLRPLLEGQQVCAANSNLPSLGVDCLVKQTIRSVEARGKHMLIHFEHGEALHSHLGMTGSWHIYRAGEAWQKPTRLAALALTVADRVIVCFSPKQLELLTPARLKQHRWLRQLGPDLLAADFDEAAVVSRFRVHDTTPLGVAVMNQSILCGIGNVYKSEVLFLERRDPFAPVGELSDQMLVALVRRARRLMRRNLQGGARVTRMTGDGQRMWVYGRNGKPCLVCGTRIEVSRQGDLGRTTFWCPACQGTSAVRRSRVNDV